MSRAVITDCYFWLASIAFGVCMALAYDFIRLFRRLVKHGKFAVDLEDLLYWTVCFFTSFTLLYYGNNGVIRFAAVLGAAVGILIYAGTLGRFFVKISFLIIDRTIGSLFRKIAKNARRLHKIASYANYKMTKFFQKSHKNKIFRQFGLTKAFFNHRINIQRVLKRDKSGAEKGVKEGTEYGSVGNIGKKKKKTEISPRQK